MLNDEFKAMLDEVVAVLELRGRNEVLAKIEKLPTWGKDALIGYIYEEIDGSIPDWVNEWLENEGAEFLEGDESEEGVISRERGLKVCWRP